MKTRIISGIVMCAILAAVLALGIYVSPFCITVFIAMIAAGGCYELIHNAAGIKSKAAWIGASVYTFINVCALDKSLVEKIITVPSSAGSASAQNASFGTYGENAAFTVSVIYFLYAVAVTLKNHKDFGLAQIAVLCAMPVVLSFGFHCLGSVINLDERLYYLLMLLNFSSICDMGAYFVGVTCGRHKLCPEISPKKTVEGAIGGTVSSLVFTVIFVLAFGREERLITSLIFTVPLCIVGMLGDLFASAIKRSADLKDYSNLIPGHGGILDRVDSMLLIAPVLYLCAMLGVL